MNIRPNVYFQAGPLALLERMRSGTIDLAYLDPPWASLVLKDQERNDAAAIANQAAALSDVAKICYQAHRVLASDGVLLARYDRFVAQRLHLVLEQVFGMRSAQHEFVLPLPRVPGTGGEGATSERLAMFTKSDRYLYIPPVRPATEEERLTRFPHRDSAGRFRIVTLLVPHGNDSMRFDFRGIRPREGWHWRYDIGRLEELEHEDRLTFGPGPNQAGLKQYAEDGAEIEVGDIWNDLPTLFHGKTNPPATNRGEEALARRVISMCSEPGDTVLIPFSGAGTYITTAIQMGRRWIAADSSEIATRIVVGRLETNDLFPGIEYALLTQEELESDFPIVNDAYPLISLGPSTTLGLDFVRGQPLPIEETKHYEFKELTGQANAAKSIRSSAEEYAVAFLNSDGGRVFWGVRDSDRTVVGVKLKYSERDEIRQVVGQQLHQIQPALPANSYALDFHKVKDLSVPVTDLWVVELRIPRMPGHHLYFTGSGKAWVKTEGGTAELRGPALIQEHERRKSLEF